MLIHSHVFVGIFAGLVSAVMALASAKPALAATLLYVLISLPLLIAGLGWGRVAALAASFTGLVFSSLLISPVFSLIYFLTTAFPAVLFTHLALLQRTPANGSAVEWYPAGRIVMISSVYAAFLMLSLTPLLGMSLVSYQASLREVLSPLISAMQFPEMTDKDKLVEVMIELLPLVLALFASLFFIINLYLAAKAVKISGLLPRPWPDLHLITFPRPFLYATAIMFILGALPGLFGHLSKQIFVCFAVAWSMIGLAVVHVGTRHNSFQYFILAAVYLVLVLLAWPFILLAFLGMADAIYNLRDRFLQPLRFPNQPKES